MRLGLFTAAGVVIGMLSLAAQQPGEGPVKPQIPPVERSPDVKSLANSVVSASSNSARDALLANAPSLVRNGLAEEICDTLADQPNLPRDTAAEVAAYALNLAERLGDVSGRALARITLGINQAERGNYDAALEHFERARAESVTANIPRRAIQAITNIGVLHRRRGDYDLALATYQQSIDFYEQHASPEARAVLYNNMGVVYEDLGKFREALALFEKSLAIRTELKARPAELAQSLGNIGSIYAHQADHELALVYLRRAVEVHAGSADTRPLALIYSNIGNQLSALERYGEAREALDRAAELAERIDDRRGLAVALYNKAEVQRAAGQFKDAVATLDRSLALAEQMSDRHRIAEVLTLLATLQVELDQPEAARGSAARAVDLAREMGDLPALWPALTNLGNVDRALGHAEEAERSLRSAVEVVEQLRLLSVGGVEAQEQAFSSRLNPYRNLVAFLADRGRAEEALLVLERARARTLLDLMASTGPAVSSEMTPDERARERALNASFVLLSKQLAGTRGRMPASDPRLQDLIGRVRGARRDLDEFHSRLDSVHPELRAQRGEMAALGGGDLAELLPNGASAAIEYVTVATNSYAFVARRSAESDGRVTVTVHRLPATADELRSRAADLHNRVATRDLNIRPLARRLYDDLIAPLEAELSGATDWRIVPDQALWDVPFPALIGPDGHYVVERAATSFTPSLSALHAMQKVTARSGVAATALLVGSATGPSPLIEAEQQARTLGRVYGQKATIITGEAATTQRFTRDAGAFAVVHIASHGVLDDASPMHSYVALSPVKGQTADSGTLEAIDLMKMKLGADVVVLSGCDTGRGRLSNGEGLIGFSWALFAAGAPSTVVSQWKVEAVSTTALMTEFHRAINVELGQSGRVRFRARALQQAALKLLRGGTYTHPAYWAPFVVMGNGS